LCTRQNIWPTKIYEVKDWRSWRLKKSKIEEAEDWRSWRLKESKLYEFKVWRSRRLKNLKFGDSTRLCNSCRVSGATDVGMPFGYPRISIAGLTH
jgi:hypothetical protein